MDLGCSSPRSVVYLAGVTTNTTPYWENVYYSPRGSCWEHLMELDLAIEEHWESGCDPPPDVQRVVFEPYHPERVTLEHFDIGSFIESRAEDLYDSFCTDFGDGEEYTPSKRVETLLAEALEALCDDYAVKMSTTCNRATDLPSVTVDITADGNYRIVGPT